MFLWVKLIVFTLKDLHFESDIQDAMNTLPEDLEAMCATLGQPGIRAPLITIQLREDHVAHMQRCEVPNQRTAVRILQWAAVAQRPLKRYELESGVVLDARVSRITEATRARGDIISLCHPVLDIVDGPSGAVSFIHFTALELVLNSTPS